MPSKPEPRVTDTPVLSPAQLAEMATLARATRAEKVEDEETDEHLPLGVVLGWMPVE
jgi:hypothetical protein